MVAALYIAGGVFIVALFVFIMGFLFAWLLEGQRDEWPFALIGIGAIGLLISVVVFVVVVSYQLISTGVARL